MFDVAVSTPSQMEAAPMQRARGEARISFKQMGSQTRLDELYQRGSAKFRLPKVYDNIPVAVLINTAGGVTGGDEYTYSARVAAGGHAILTSQAAERAYRRSAGNGTITTRLTAEADAFVEWLPQETILFNASALHRSMTVDLKGNARFLGIESIVLGRTAMGETIDTVSFRDRWRIHRDGKLVFADDARLEGNTKDILKGSATTSGGLAFATLIDCDPNAETRIDRARNALKGCGPGTSVRAAASAWNGVLTARFVAADGRALRDALMSFLETYRSAPLPRVWHC
ncbi:urease accessory protein [Roseibium polysiphoniae]|uniref:Urease accessory protein UreD n=1 Tax=Roseibium polysiphoniae TaxID=2571221 RepID=A0A944GTF9_9HYPH|nr:urease accessory protein UreD [Roseibium polysiphoniae]MBS8261758.1 urease accessory protein [Roseibium polysiphoniae]